ncbi:MAG: hypothetical protein CSB33_05480 [Desulfobacterales bacterium]|nr:MAG: hypothetical protein CSB33_05480 [Desulfobacterales bacterium]
MIIKKCLHPLKTRQIDTLILADPYYTVLKRIIQRKIGRRVALVDPGDIMADKLGSLIGLPKGEVGDLKEAAQLDCWVTDLTKTSARIARDLFGQHVALEKVSVAGEGNTRPGHLLE